MLDVVLATPPFRLMIAIVMEPIAINVNGYDTYFTECKDSAGNYLLIAIPSNAGKDISEICGTIINGHFIKMIDYAVSNNIRFIKAYY